MTPDTTLSTAPFGAFAPNAAQAAIISLTQGTGLKRGAFRPWMSRLVNLLRRGPVDVQYQGASFRFYHQGSATERGALFNPDYNLDELDFLRQHTPDGGTFIDVGANVGTFALVMARQVGPTGKVYAIDAATANGAALFQFVAQSGVTHMSDSTKLLLTIQGALVLARARNDTKIFRRALAELKTRLLAPAN